MMDWKDVFVRGFAPSLPTAGLERLHAALESDDPAIMQGGVTRPPAIANCLDLTVDRVDAVAFCGWEPDQSVGTVQTAYRLLTQEAAVRLGDADWSCPSLAPFYRWYDRTPRAEVFRELAAVVAEVLAARGVTVTDWRTAEAINGRR
jgi:hypothetical protein